jgi:hypothetical protein
MTMTDRSQARIGVPEIILPLFFACRPFERDMYSTGYQLHVSMGDQHRQVSAAICNPYLPLNRTGKL